MSLSYVGWIYDYLKVWIAFDSYYALVSNYFGGYFVSDWTDDCFHDVNYFGCVDGYFDVVDGHVTH